MAVKFPDFLQNNNPNAVLIDATENQTKGFGFFDAITGGTVNRDDLNESLQVDGYLAIVGTTLYKFGGGTWDTTSDWDEVGGTAPAIENNSGTPVLATNITAAEIQVLLNLEIGEDVQAYDPDLGAIAALAGTAGLLKKTAADTWALDTATYITGYTVTQGDVTGHQAALVITESQISDLAHYTDASVNTHLNQSSANSGQYLKWTGSDYAWATVSSGGLGNVVEDTAPQLGADLDANGFSIDMGTYTITDAKVGQWDTAHSWGDHAGAGYSTLALGTASDTALAGDTAVALTTNNLSVFAATTSIQLLGVLSDETGTGQVVFSASPTLTGTVGAAAITTTGNVIVGGTLTVAGDFISQEATIVTFRDSFLDLNVSGSLNDDYTSNSGFHFGRSTSGIADTLDEKAALTYDGTNDLFKFTRHTDSSTGAVANADNVAALKFAATDTVVQTDQADALTTMPDDDFANAASARSLGAVAKCRITITSTADGTSNFAPDIQGANGYVIKHNLNTASIYVVAIKDPGSTPIPIFCKYEPIDANIVRVTVGITTDNEVYDIIVIG